MVSFTYRMGAGFPGDYNRTAAGQTVTPEAANPSFPIPAYGVPVKFVANGIGPIAVGDQPGVIIGILLREFPGQAMPPNSYGAGQTLSVAPVPPTQGPLSAMRRGFVSVAVNSGSSAAAAKGNPVYVWNIASTAGHTLGGIEATDVPGSTILMPTALFRGSVDSSGVVEIEFNL